MNYLVSFVAQRLFYNNFFKSNIAFIACIGVRFIISIASNSSITLPAFEGSSKSDNCPCCFSESSSSFKSAVTASWGLIRSTVLHQLPTVIKYQLPYPISQLVNQLFLRRVSHKTYPQVQIQFYVRR